MSKLYTTDELRDLADQYNFEKDIGIEDENVNAFLNWLEGKEEEAEEEQEREDALPRLSHMWYNPLDLKDSQDKVLNELLALFVLHGQRKEVPWGYYYHLRIGNGKMPEEQLKFIATLTLSNASESFKISKYFQSSKHTVLILIPKKP